MIRFFSRFLICCLAVVSCQLQAQEQQAPVSQAGQQPENASAAQLAVLSYARFAAGEGMGGITATTFAAQMKFLKSRGITAVSLQQFLDWHQGKAALPGNSVLITLDEADSATYSVAFPVLQELGYPFVIFADGRNLSGNGAALNLEQLQELQDAGGTIGSRSMTRPRSYDWKHAALAGPDALLKMAELEMGLSAQRISSAFGECLAFSYPHGYADADMVENLAIYGYKVAFGLREGRVQQGVSAYTLPRYRVNDMPAFARAVNFGQGQSDDVVLQQIYAEAARHLPVSKPAEVISSESGAAVFPPFADKGPRAEAEQPPLPPVLEGPAGELSSAPDAGNAEIPTPEVEVFSLANLPDPQLCPRPVSTKPASGVWERRTPEADWTTREFPQPEVPREKTRVAVLGYHDFSNSRPVTEMRMRTSEFCQQMQYIKDAGLTVITMQDFLDWLQGKRCLPERCVLITIDDGWRSVYTDAFPVLRAYGYPFTLYLYTSYISGRGYSMDPDMVQEMMAAGATIGSHSATHLYPSQWKRFAEDSPEYAAQLKQEFPDSVADIKAMFGNCSTYCYPGGYVTPPMQEALRQAGISAAFTVLERKVTSLEDPLQVHRYMVFGNDSRIFRRAVNFDDVPGIKPTAQGITEARARARAFFPKAFETPPPPAPGAQKQQPQQMLTAPSPEERPRPVLEDIPAPSYVTPGY